MQPPDQVIQKKRKNGVRSSIAALLAFRERTYWGSSIVPICSLWHITDGETRRINGVRLFAVTTVFINAFSAVLPQSL